MLKEKLIDNLLKNKMACLWLILVGLISFLVFKDSFYFQVYLANPHWVSDIPRHTSFTLNFAEEKTFPIYTIWYILVYLCSGFSKNFDVLARTSIILLTLLMAIKYLITNVILLEDNKAQSLRASFFAMAMVFVMPILSYWTAKQYPNVAFVSNWHVYLGNIAPNQWHNSTLILATPFNLVWFYFSVNKIKSSDLLDFVRMGILGALSILCKPSFALVFLPILCFSLIILNYRSQNLVLVFIKSAIVAIPGLIMLFLQWYFTFKHNHYLVIDANKTIFAPFLVWRYFSPHIGLSLLLSTAFPLAVLVLFLRSIDKFFMMALFTFLTAVLVAVCFAEYPVFAAGNYFWSAIAVNYILFLSAIKILLRQKLDYKAIFCYLIFFMHFCSGIFLLWEFFIKQAPLIL